MGTEHKEGEVMSSQKPMWHSREADRLTWRILGALGVLILVIAATFAVLVVTLLHSV
jgi:hypothetical protein